MIQLSDVSQTFTGRTGQVTALQRINLDIHSGEFVAIVGRSGCGKSTLLRIMAGLLPPTSGQVLIGGEPVTRPRQDVSMMFQRPALLPWRSVLDNVLLPAEVFRWRRRAHRDRAMRLLEMVGLAGFAKRRPHELSGGMQQRVALCRSLISNPRLMLMDEPFSALDALTREELSAELQRVHMDHSATIVLVTHSIDEAVLLADRVVVLSARPGQVRACVEINIPRPRTLSGTAHLPEVARCGAQLRALLTERPSAEQVAPRLAGLAATADRI